MDKLERTEHIVGIVSGVVLILFLGGLFAMARRRLAVEDPE